MKIKKTTFHAVYSKYTEHVCQVRDVFDMNFARPLNRDKVMEWGDLVVIYESHDSMDFIFLESEKILNVCKKRLI